MAKGNENVCVSVIVTQELKAEMEKVAEADQRSVASYIRKLIVDDLGRRSVQLPLAAAASE